MLDKKLKLPLFSLRLGVAIVFLLWSIDKVINPQHGAKVFEKFYGLENLGVDLLVALGVAQFGLIVAFLAGYKQRLTYGLIFLMHLGSTLSSFEKYLDPWNNMLFFAAFPMLAATWTLYILRDYDTFLTFRK